MQVYARCNGKANSHQSLFVAVNTWPYYHYPRPSVSMASMWALLKSPTTCLWEMSTKGERQAERIVEESQHSSPPSAVPCLGSSAGSSTGAMMGSRMLMHLKGRGRKQGFRPGIQNDYAQGFISTNSFRLCHLTSVFPSLGPYSETWIFESLKESSKLDYNYNYKTLNFRSYFDSVLNNMSMSDICRDEIKTFEKKNVIPGR